MIACLALTGAALGFGANAPAPSPVPVPAQIITAKTLFLANGGSLDNASSYKAYQALYKTLAAHHYEMLDSPAKAELSLELSLDQIVDSVMNGDSSNLAVLRLRVRDTKTQSLLWTFVEPVPRAALRKTFDRNVGDTIPDLANDLFTLAASGAEGSEQPVPSTGTTKKGVSPTYPPQKNTQGKTRYSQREQDN